MADDSRERHGEDRHDDHDDRPADRRHPDDLLGHSADYRIARSASGGSSGDDFNLLRSKRALYPAIAGLILVIAILLLPLIL